MCTNKLEYATINTFMDPRCKCARLSGYSALAATWRCWAEIKSRIIIFLDLFLNFFLESLKCSFGFHVELIVPQNFELNLLLLTIPFLAD